MSDRVWVFDLDDTGMNTCEVYLKVIEEACRYMMSTDVFGDCSPALARLKQKQLEIDSALRTKINQRTKKPYYYSRERFPLSLVETYKYFCKELNMETDYMIERDLFEIGGRVYLKVAEYLKAFKPEFCRLIPFLHSKGDILMLFTKGDQGIQQRKIRAMERLGLLKFFHKVKIVKDKNQKVFKALKKGFRGKRFYSVGNEYPADIAPAIKEGYFGIYIPSMAVWERGKLERIEELRDKEHSVRYGNLSEIRQKYHYLCKV